MPESIAVPRGSTKYQRPLTDRELLLVFRVDLDPRAGQHWEAGRRQDRALIGAGDPVFDLLVGQVDEHRPHQVVGFLFAGIHGDERNLGHVVQRRLSHEVPVGATGGRLLLPELNDAGGLGRVDLDDPHLIPQHFLEAVALSALAADADVDGLGVAADILVVGRSNVVDLEHLHERSGAGGLLRRQVRQVIGVRVIDQDVAHAIEHRVVEKCVREDVEVTSLQIDVLRPYIQVRVGVLQFQ
jgi:hypothetical protein